MACRKISLGTGLAVSLVWVVVFGLASVTWAEEPEAKPKVAAEISVTISFGLEIDRASRTLVAPQKHFSADNFRADEGQVFCLSRVVNMTAPATLTHVWYHEGKTMARVDLPVGSADWRTWSSKRILPAWKGQWEVKVLDDSGMVLTSAGFVVD